MKRSSTGIIWGLLIIVLGILIGAKAFGMEFDIFFDGFWTLFIIIPSAIGLTEKGNRTGSMIGLSIGILLLLAARDIIQWDMFGKLILAVIFIIIGIKLIYEEITKNKYGDSSSNFTYSKDSTYSYTDEKSSKNYYDSQQTDTSNQFSQEKKNESDYKKQVVSIFSGKDMNFNGKEFHGIAISAVFGGADLDLRNAIITKDCIIDVTVIFGGIDIKVGDNVRIVMNCSPIFGGVEDHTNYRGGVEGSSNPTLYINGACIFGGIDIK